MEGGRSTFARENRSSAASGGNGSFGAGVFRRESGQVWLLRESEERSGGSPGSYSAFPVLICDIAAQNFHPLCRREVRMRTAKEIQARAVSCFLRTVAKPLRTEKLPLLKGQLASQGQRTARYRPKVGGPQHMERSSANWRAPHGPIMFRRVGPWDWQPQP